MDKKIVTILFLGAEKEVKISDKAIFSMQDYVAKFNIVKTNTPEDYGINVRINGDDYCVVGNRKPSYKNVNESFIIKEIIDRVIYVKCGIVCTRIVILLED